MRIGEVAQRVGVTPQAVRFYEERGLLPDPARGPNGYRDYREADEERLRLLVGLRSLGLPLESAGSLANLCASGECERVSADLLDMMDSQRTEIRRRIADLRYLETRLRTLEAGLLAGSNPRPLITIGGKEEAHDSTV